MSTTTFKIEESLFGKFPALSVAAVRVRFSEPRNLAALLPGLAAKAREAARRTSNVEQISDIAEVGCWRTAYAQMGVKPSKFQSSIESLLRRARKGDSFSTGIEIVDFYNSISVINFAPLGAYDADKLGDHPICLRYCEPGSDLFSPLGGEASSFPLNPSLVIYASEAKVLCWGFNTRDSKDVCVDENTRNVIFFSEMTDEVFRHRPAQALEQLRAQIADVIGSPSKVLSFDRFRPAGAL
jgi:DNA/RNA-binding domain of Phe-tRNA-synthetase-like protein